MGAAEWTVLAVASFSALTAGYLALARILRPELNLWHWLD